MNPDLARRTRQSQLYSPGEEHASAPAPGIVPGPVGGVEIRVWRDEGDPHLRRAAGATRSRKHRTASRSGRISTAPAEGWPVQCPLSFRVRQHMRDWGCIWFGLLVLGLVSLLIVFPRPWRRAPGRSRPAHDQRRIHAVPAYPGCLHRQPRLRSDCRPPNPLAAAIRPTKTSRFRHRAAPRKEWTVLRPIATREVFQHNCIRGRAQVQIHLGVPWWLGAIFVDPMRAERIVLAHRGAPARRWADRFATGAINSRHWACRVTNLGRLLLFGIGQLGVPGALVAWHYDSGHVNLVFRLYSASGAQLDEFGGLAEVRRRIESDRVPRPVDQRWQGRIEAASELVRAFQQQGHTGRVPVRGSGRSAPAFADQFEGVSCGVE